MNNIYIKCGDDLIPAPEGKYTLEDGTELVVKEKREKIQFSDAVINEVVDKLTNDIRKNIADYLRNYLDREY